MRCRRKLDGFAQRPANGSNLVSRAKLEAEECTVSRLGPRAGWLIHRRRLSPPGSACYTELAILGPAPSNPLSSVPFKVPERIWEWRRNHK